jgi:RNA polymerase sigma-70 factor (ECF subfamily)
MEDVRLAESDEQLVVRTRQGDRAAFAQLVERYEKPGLAVARSILRSWHDTRDAVQDAFVTAYQRLNRLWSPRKFGAWFLRIVRRQALWHRRRNAARERRVGPMMAEPAYRTPGRPDCCDGVSELIGRLPEQECVVVSLRHLQDLSVAEIAGVTGRPVGTVTKQLSRAYARMRPWLDAER